ncbi:Ni/Fe hydrogenase subunit alpha [candidate division GN15 bacterium]|uniref:Ni/Fe hydrogenase subunit alpha n=1 Tax=candidate division GN15 bacterium TaxID=2072418 RepID=A0A855X830_9BACT|nr:MAG: Ni/Fe hydrogenase subunit alpha [candidate division GN15 bacterium]
MSSKTIKVEALARVEGEGGIQVKVKGGKVDHVKLVIFEPPRFFEAFLRGRRYDEAPDITARICGICPVAYQMSSCHAMEGIGGVTVDGQLRELRRLLYCGEWIESHALHVYMLHAPDFLGYEDAIQLAGDYPEIVKKALELKKIGNDLMALVGGREIHPINVRVGGFYRVPTKAELTALLDKLKWARDVSIETTRFVSGFEFPKFERDYEFVSLRHPSEYPLCEGRLVSNRGMDIDLSEYESNFAEEHVEHSNALQSVHVERGTYFVGPLARYNLNFDRLPASAQQVARDVKLELPCTNPFRGIIVRSVELVFACEEAIRIIEAYDPPQKPFVPMTPREGTGRGCTEAPRGILYHRYKIDHAGIIQDAKIVPPTAQNLRTIEQDLAQYVEANHELNLDDLTWQCEQAVRNYDPCISCATHALKVKINRE